MKEKINTQFDRLKEYWVDRTRTQKLMFGGSLLIILFVIFTIFYFTTKTSFVPLYTNLTPSETGSIKESLDAKGIKSEITNGGSTIKVPEENAESLMVELAAEGIPKSGQIDYSFFGENAGFGMTDNEFNVLKLSAMQTELAELMKTIEGINQANVRINLPDKGIFLNDSTEEASAAIVLQTEPGYEFNEKQIKSLYYLVSKAVPNLPVENIVIRNQYLEYFDLNQDQYAENGVTQQMQIKKQVERDIQRQVQNMLGTLMGFDKVVTSVTADIDFTQENREENIATPVDEENMKGLAISAHKITETYTGNGDQAGGVPPTGDEADAGGTEYLEGTDGNGDYEKTEETINNEINRIRKKIVESPYKVRDLGIQVMVEPPNPEDVNTFPQDRIQDIRDILSTIVKTSIDKEIGTDLSDEAVESKVNVSVQPFNGKIETEEPKGSSIPWWIYVVGGLLLIIIAILVIFLLRNRKGNEEIVEEEEELAESTEEQEEIPDLQEEAVPETTMRRRQLEKLAKEKPDEFAKLLRTWLAED
ncbi:flagellar M-ring protein FliF [Lederbergia sp. NSJ-179]|uniref:flagellar basal-body MS-ring/collar protein FliF n=1 Tax=Lederbergia sp. NSJ-179 TaxID=2931402 RepID=UPI001FD02F07|nr:flagellar basal-body MS-ring/collar protein FliF [Lederbergia sp. NSJ-179]MCJ7839637.1 flagellar M-ring protein FliF [Lederbergia sp. NSJ-179]